MKNLRKKDMVRAQHDVWLSREESNRLKGLLVLLIMLGHHHVLVPVESSLFSWFYTFHVICFFIIPYFYKTNIDSKKWIYIWELVKRNMIPYTVFFGFNLLLLGKTRLFSVQILDIVKAYFIGSPSVLRESTGFIFLWFLPAYMSFSILLFFSRKNKLVRIVILCFSFMIVFLPFEYSENLRNNIPFGLFNGVAYYWLGCALLFVLCKSYYVVYCGPFMFVLLSFLYFSNISLPFIITVMPVFAFLSFFLIVKNVTWRWLGEIGKYSLEIYLLHIYLLSIFQRLLPNTLYVGIATYLLTLLIAYGLAIGISKTKLKFIFHPKITFHKQ